MGKTLKNQRQRQNFVHEIEMISTIDQWSQIQNKHGIIKDRGGQQGEEAMWDKDGVRNSMSTGFAAVENEISELERKL